MRKQCWLNLVFDLANFNDYKDGDKNVMTGVKIVKRKVFEKSLTSYELSMTVSMPDP